MKPKILLPSLKEKKRYLAFEVKADTELAHKDARQAIRNEMSKLVGDIGMAKAGLMFLDDWKDNKGILKVNNKSVDEAKAALTMLQKINNKKVIVKSIGVSGILNKIRQKGGF